MKHLLNKLMWSAMLLFAAVAIVGCTDPDKGPDDQPQSPYSLKAEMVAPGATTVTIKVTTEKITRFAYLVNLTPDINYNASQIFNQGREMEAEADGTTNFTMSGLNPDTDYSILFAAATVDETWYDQVVELTFKTGSLEDEITIYDIDYRGFRVHVNWPETVKEGNVLKWGVADYYMYHYTGASDAAKLNMHDKEMGNYITDSHTFIIDNEIENCCPPDGKGGYDTNYPYYGIIVPGQLTYFFIGEFSYVDADNIGYWYTDEDGDEIYVDFTNGFHEPGYYNALFDEAAWRNAGSPQVNSWGISPLAVEAVTDQSQYWSGFYACYKFNTKAPEKLDGEVVVDKSGLKLNGGTLRFLPSENVALYLYGIFTQSNWESIIRGLPDSNEESIQWFLTTEEALYSYGVGAEYGPAEIDVSGAVTWFDTETEYIVAIIGMGNEEGTSQFFQVETFKLPAPTKPAPTIEVTAITKPTEEIAKDGAQSPYEIWYNVKCPTKDAYQVMYACNTARAWESALAIYGSYEDIIRWGGYFSSDEVVAINSDAGFNVRFDVLPESTYGFGAVGFSDEGRMGKADYVENTAGVEPLPDPIASNLYEDLKGEWTMRTHIHYTVYNNQDLTYSLEEGIRQSKVTIGDIVMPESLSSEVYDRFQTKVGWDQDKVDNTYEEICNQVDLYNARTRSENRILCQGLDTYPIPYYLNYSQLEYCSPYSLFYGISSLKYGYYDAASVLYDFGPKWFIEVMDDQGTLGVPFNANTMAPIFGLSEYHLVGLNSTAPTSAWNTISFVFDEKGNATTGYFPVEVSDDLNTITVKPLKYNGQSYYPIVASWSGVQFEAAAYSVGELVLTRGWEAGTEPIVPVDGTRAARVIKQQPSMGGEAPAQQVKSHSLTRFELENPILYKQVEGQILTEEESAARMKEYMTR